MDTQKTEKKKVNWFRTIRPIALVLVLVLILSYSTYAWMKRDWTPTLHQEGVRIVAGSSLVFLFEEDEITDRPINELEGMGDFVFKSVSNCSGKSDDFFALNYSPKGEYYDTFKHLSPDELSDEDKGSSAPYMILGKKYGYVELEFKVRAAAGDTEKDKYIKLHSDSHIGAATEGNVLDTNAVNAMRISITVPDGNGATKTIVFSPNGTHEGITNAHEEGVGYVADGVSRYVFDANGTPTLATKVRDYDIVENKAIVDTLPMADDDYLFKLVKGTTETITVRIWLEGEDDYCTDEKILGAKLDILLKFTAADVE